MVVVTTLAGTKGTVATFNRPAGITVSCVALFVSDDHIKKIQQLTVGLSVCLWTGKR